MADETAWLNANIHATASDWSARVVTNGGAAPSSNTVTAVSNFCGALDSAGIANLMVAANIFAPDSLIAALTPLYKVYGNDPWTNTNFVVDDLSIQGLRGDGSSKYLDTGVLPSSPFPAVQEGGLALYNTMPNRAAGVDFNTINAGAFYLQLNCFNASGNASFRAWGGGAGEVLSASTLPYGLGFTSGNRLSSTSANIYVANSQIAFVSIGSIATTANTPPGTTMVLFANNNNGVIGTYSSKRFSFASIHHGLSSAQCQNLFNAVQALRVALGGGYV